MTHNDTDDETTEHSHTDASQHLATTATVRTDGGTGAHIDHDREHGPERDHGDDHERDHENENENENEHDRDPEREERDDDSATNGVARRFDDDRTTGLLSTKDSVEFAGEHVLPDVAGQYGQQTGDIGTRNVTVLFPKAEVVSLDREIKRRQLNGALPDDLSRAALIRVLIRWWRDTTDSDEREHAPGDTIGEMIKTEATDTRHAPTRYQHERDDSEPPSGGGGGNASTHSRRSTDESDVADGSSDLSDDPVETARAEHASANAEESTGETPDTDTDDDTDDEANGETADNPTDN